MKQRERCPKCGNKKARRIEYPYGVMSYIVYVDCGKCGFRGRVGTEYGGALEMEDGSYVGDTFEGVKT